MDGLTLPVDGEVLVKDASLPLIQVGLEVPNQRIPQNSHPWVLQTATAQRRHQLTEAPIGARPRVGLVMAQDAPRESMVGANMNSVGKWSCMSMKVKIASDRKPGEC